MAEGGTSFEKQFNASEHEVRALILIILQMKTPCSFHKSHLNCKQTKSVLVALGGNALLTRGEKPTSENQVGAVSGLLSNDD